jgi:hypothetical protein
MAEKKLVGKILTHELFQWHWVNEPKRRIVQGPILARCIGWDAVDAFLRLHGTAMVHSTITTASGPPFRMISFPDGWGGHCVNMENIFEEALWPTA